MKHGKQKASALQQLLKKSKQNLSLGRVEERLIKSAMLFI